MKPLVSIICISYNQEKYIRQALEGFLMQDVNFSYEIIIHDDASTDGTQVIIQEYIDKNPKVFRPVLQKENRYSKTGVLFLKEMYQMTRGKYVAVCEGDDFWIDPTKLQKQVDFLEKNDDYSMVFHPVKVVFEDGEEIDSIFPETSNRAYFTLKNLLKTNYIHTNSALYRHQDYTNVNPDVMPMDWYMHLYHAQSGGKIGFINTSMSVYRKHREGIWWQATHRGRDEIWKKHGAGHLVLYTELLKMYGDTPDYQKIIDIHIEGTVDILSRIDGSDKTTLMKSFVEKFPELSVPLFLSLSRTTYRNYRHVEKENEIHKKTVQEAFETIEGLRQERENILNSRTYKVSKKIAQVSRVVRSKK